MFRGTRSIKLGTIAGMRIGVDVTWFAMLFIWIFLLSGSFRTALHSNDDVAYLIAVVTVLLFYCSLIIHELGHAFMARRSGIQVQRIELYGFGGTTEEFRIAAAGPLGTVLFIVLCLIVDLLLVGSHRLIHAIALDGTVQITPVLLALSWLLPMNVLILLFNIVPAYPLDGGRIARALIWRITGDKLRGTRSAARIGEGFATALGTFGLYITLGDPGFVKSWFGDSSFVGLWLMLLAFMIWQSARMALNGTAAASRVQGVRVADIMDHEPVVIRGTSTVEQALDESFLRYQSEWLPVIDGDRRFIGIARRARAEELVHSGGGDATVGSILEPDAGPLTILEGSPLTDVLTLESLGRLGAVMATDADHVLTGVVTIDQVRRVLQTVLVQPTAP
jgi:Zn-dependent protease